MQQRAMAVNWRRFCVAVAAPLRRRCTACAAPGANAPQQRRKCAASSLPWPAAARLSILTLRALTVEYCAECRGHMRYQMSFALAHDFERCVDTAVRGSDDTCCYECPAVTFGHMRTLGQALEPAAGT